MLRIGQVENTAQNGKYTDGNVAGGVAATRLRAAAFNAMQEELANIVESAGMQLSVDDMTQVLTALKKLFLSRANPFADIKSDGAAAVAVALSNLGLVDANGYSGRKINEQWITSSRTYIPTAGTKRIKVTITGGGGGGGGAFNGGNTNDNFSGAGGAAGATGIKWFNISSITNFAVVIGTGGGEVSRGGDSTFSGIVATGGRPAGASTVYTSGGVGAAGTGADINLSGGDGGDGQNGARLLVGCGGASFWGGSRRASQGTVSSPVVTKATTPGGGGGGAYDVTVLSTRFYGGAGADGICLIEEFA